MKTELSKNKLSIKKCPICNCKLPVHKLSCPAVSTVVFLPPCSSHELENQKEENMTSNIKENLKKGVLLTLTTKKPYIVDPIEEQFVLEIVFELLDDYKILLDKSIYNDTIIKIMNL